MVLWDRYVGSALAYRAAELELGSAAAAGFDVDFVRMVNSRFRPPDLVLYVDISPATSIARCASSKKGPYGLDLLMEVQRQYEKMGSELKEHFIRIDGEASPAEVAEQAVTALTRALPGA